MASYAPISSQADIIDSMDIKPKMIGIASLDELLKTWEEPQPWQPHYYPYIPLEIIKYPPTYLLTLGSGSLTSTPTSLATTSVFGQRYRAAIDVFRNDLEDGKRVIDVDHYVFVNNGGVVTAWMYPPVPYHHLKLTDKIVEVTPEAWGQYIKSTLSIDSR